MHSEDATDAGPCEGERVSLGHVTLLKGFEAVSSRKAGKAEAPASSLSEHGTGHSHMTSAVKTRKARKMRGRA